MDKTGAGLQLPLIKLLNEQMIIRKYKTEDAAKIDEIHDRCHKNTFGRPNLSHVLDAAVVEIDKKIVGYGCLELITEAVMIIDTDLPLVTRTRILTNLIESAKFIGKERGFDRFYMFPSDDRFMNLLIKHYNFDTCSPILCCERVSDKEGKG